MKPSRSFDSGQELKLLIEHDGAAIKVEANYILRGFVLPAEVRALVKAARERFEVSASVQTVSLADLYGGKICAALDRQHPRDLFDVKFLLENEGLTDAVRHAFFVYLMSHNRPMNELWNPNWQDMDQAFATEFDGMTTLPVTLAELKSVRVVAREVRILLSYKDLRVEGAFRADLVTHESRLGVLAQAIYHGVWRRLRSRRATGRPK